MKSLNIKFRNKKIQEKYDDLYKYYLLDIPKEYVPLYKNSIIRLKKHTKDERTIILAILYWLLFFWLINTRHPMINSFYRDKLIILKKSYKYEMEGEKVKYLKNLFEMEQDLFMVKMVMKLTILSYWKKYLNLIENKKNYLRFSWLIIPYLTLRESRFLWFFQDIYFQNLFPWKYRKTKAFYFKKIKKIELPWEHLISILNSLADTMAEAKVIWKTKIRRKTYFSIYNKIKRKNWKEIFDILWARIIFKSIKDLKKFIEIFEEKYIFITKKDYVTSPKNNWYKSIHYSYSSLFKDIEIMVELQLRTEQMDRDIHGDKNISHFNYTLSKNKWGKEFSEVNFGFNYLNKYIKKHNL